jgi:hypothetical protein
LGLSSSGENASQGVELNPRLKISYDLTPKIAGGFEYYGSLGPLRGFYTFQKEKHQIFPVIDLNLVPDWDFNFGVGFGLTEGEAEQFRLFRTGDTAVPSSGKRFRKVKIQKISWLQA